MMFRLSSAWALLLFFCAALTSAAFAQTAEAPPTATTAQVTLQVRVMGEGNLRLPEAVSVELLDKTDTRMTRAYTDTMGNVRFTVKPGTYKLRVSGTDIRTRDSARFEIHGMQRTHVETIVVSPETSPGTSDSTSSAATVSAAALKIPRGAQRAFDRGGAAMERQQWQEAIQHFQRAIVAFPEYAHAHNNLGVAFMRAGDAERGRQAFERAWELDENMVGAGLNLARLAYAAQQLDRVKELLRRTVAIEPGNAEALMLLANAQLRTGEMEEALRNARLVHAVGHARFASAHLIAARALEMLNRHSEAAAEYELYLQEAPEGDNAAQARAALQALRQNAP